MKLTKEQIAAWKKLCKEEKRKAKRNGVLASDSNFKVYWNHVVATGLCYMSGWNEDMYLKAQEKTEAAWKKVTRDSRINPAKRATGLYTKWLELQHRAQSAHTSAHKKTGGTDAISYEKGEPTTRRSTGRKGGF